MQTPDLKERGHRAAVVWAVIALTVIALVGLRVANVIHPRSCTSCHERGAFGTATQTSPHAGVDCEDCHIAPGTVGAVAFTLRRPMHAYVSSSRKANRDAATVPDSRCATCHEEALTGVVASNGINVNHESCAVNASCVDCHSTVAHGAATKWARSYEMDTCVECHLASDNVACDLCHEGKRETERVKVAFSVTHGPNWETTHGMGNVATCTVCHSASDCADCHGAGVPHEPEFVDVHSAYAAGPDAQCSTCHEETFCSDCHGTKMPHPAEFTPEHSSLAEQDPELCERCHDETDCTNCHVTHVHPGGAIGSGSTGAES